MKEKVGIFTVIYRETQARYPHIDLRKFEILYHGWRQQGFRNGRPRQFYVVAWRRGWLAPKDASDFRKYIGLV